MTVIIYDQRCAAEARRLRKSGELEEPPRRVVINEAVCEGCGDCSTKSNCLSVLPRRHRVRREARDPRPVVQPRLHVPRGRLPVVRHDRRRSRAGRRRRRRARRPRRRRSRRCPTGELPRPAARRRSTRQYGIYFTGIGGTGVVTANRIIAAAAEAAGLVVEGMDQTGLSQKAGAVVSHLHLARDRAALGSAAVGTEGADLYLSGDILQAAGAEPPGEGATRPDDRGDRHRAARPPRRCSRPMLDGARPRRRSSRPSSSGSARTGWCSSTRSGSPRRSSPTTCSANIVLLGAAFQLGGLPLSLARPRRGHRAAGGRRQHREAFAWGRWVVARPRRGRAPRCGAASGASDRRRASSTRRPRRVAAGTQLVASRDVPDELRTPARPARRPGRRLPGPRRWPSASSTWSRRSAATDDADRGWALTTRRRRVVVQAPHLQGRVRGRPPAPQGRLRRRGPRPRHRGRLHGDLPAPPAGPPAPGPEEEAADGQALRRRLPRCSRRMKRLRGTKLDLFGLDRDRRAERAVIEEYAALVPHLTGATGLGYETRVELAASAESIKGYATVKDRGDRAVAGPGPGAAGRRPGSRPGGELGRDPGPVIQRIRFATRRAGVDAAAFEAALRGLAMLARAEPPEVRPVRATVSVVLPGLAAAPPQHDGVARPLVRRRGAPGPVRGPARRRRRSGRGGRAVRCDRRRRRSPVVVVDEVVVRGEAWLEQRWSDRTSPVQAPRPRPAGRGPDARGAVAAVARPRRQRPPRRVRRPHADPRRGPRPRLRAGPPARPGRRATGAYDAVSEVWFDDVDGLQQTHRLVRRQPDRPGSRRPVRGSPGSSPCAR